LFNCVCIGILCVHVAYNLINGVVVVTHTYTYEILYLNTSVKYVFGDKFR